MSRPKDPSKDPDKTAASFTYDLGDEYVVLKKDFKRITLEAGDVVVTLSGGELTIIERDSSLMPSSQYHAYPKTVLSFPVNS